MLVFWGERGLYGRRTLVWWRHNQIFSTGWFTNGASLVCFARRSSANNNDNKGINNNHNWIKPRN